MQFMMIGIQIVYRVQVQMIFQFVSYKDGKIEACQKVHKHPPTRLLQMSKKLQSASILID